MDPTTRALIAQEQLGHLQDARLNGDDVSPVEILELEEELKAALAAEAAQGGGGVLMARDMEPARAQAEAALRQQLAARVAIGANLAGLLPDRRPAALRRLAEVMLAEGEEPYSQAEACLMARSSERRPDLQDPAAVDLSDPATQEVARQLADGGAALRPVPKPAQRPSTSRPLSWAGAARRDSTAWRMNGLHHSRPPVGGLL